MFFAMSTKLIRSIYNLSNSHKNGVITIGNFDGVHLGHQALLAEVCKKAHQLGVPSFAMTLEPHPFEFFSDKKEAIPRITRLREKFKALAETGIDYVVVLSFNQSLALKSASDFIREILVNPLSPSHIIIGDDFHFGHQRLGDLALLQKQASQYGYQAEAISSVLMEGLRVSSTRVRLALQAGDLRLAERLLGRPFTLLGRVAYGKQLGRQLGFPTINIHLHRKRTPIEGVYVVKVHGLSTSPLKGAANIGTRPTVDGTVCLLEVHLLDFNQDVYGRYVTVEFCEKLHDEIRYPNLDVLKENIAVDVEAARNYFE
jgi:riboflavin kinase/FMN adenylyltransferase